MGNNPSFNKGDNLPVEQVSWNDIQTFIKKLNKTSSKHYRLPTEAEWEFAARGGNKSKGYKYSGSDNLGSVAWYDENSGNKTHPVGQKQANELGIYDMSGNVWECCQDWFKGYTGSKTYINDDGIKPTSRVRRGGDYYHGTDVCRSTYRSEELPSDRFNTQGFRLVLAP
jgi:formylglycine-generating enzyme required for sulfatase activity